MSAKPQSTAAIESTKRKRNSVVFDGVAPPERKRKVCGVVLEWIAAADLSDHVDERRASRIVSQYDSSFTTCNIYEERREDPT